MTKMISSQFGKMKRQRTTKLKVKKAQSKIVDVTRYKITGDFHGSNNFHNKPTPKGGNQ